jgi:hypothetical protein
MWSRGSVPYFVEQKPSPPFLGFFFGALGSMVLWAVLAWALWVVML